MARAGPRPAVCSCHGFRDEAEAARERIASLERSLAETQQALDAARGAAARGVRVTHVRAAAAMVMACVACSTPAPAPEPAPAPVAVSDVPPVATPRAPAASEVLDVDAGEAPFDPRSCGTAGSSTGRRSATGHVRASEPEVHGALGREDAARALRRHVPEVRDCYEAALLEAPDLALRLDLTFTIAPDGGVSGLRVRADRRDQAALETCVHDALARSTFPAPPDGRRVRVSTHYTLDTAADE